MGTRCDCYEGRGDNQKNGVIKKTNPKYGTKAWKIKRSFILEQFHYMDVLAYYRSGVMEAAEMVHHIIPLGESPERWLEDDNLIPLSNRTHAIVEAEYDKDTEAKKRMQEELRKAITYWKERSL